MSDAALEEMRQRAIREAQMNLGAFRPQAAAQQPMPPTYQQPMPPTYQQPMPPTHPYALQQQQHLYPPPHYSQAMVGQMVQAHLEAMRQRELQRQQMLWLQKEQREKEEAELKAEAEAEAEATAAGGTKHGAIADAAVVDSALSDDSVRTHEKIV